MKKHCTLARIIVAAAPLLIGRICSAESNPVDVVKNAVHAGYPNVTIVDVRPAPIPGWYEVFTGSQVVYSDASGGHLFVGKLIETQTHKDLAEEELDKRLTIDFQKLPFERAIRIVKGNGTHRLALFEDPDCPFCQQLEQQLTDVNDVTLYVFLYPFAELHPQARAHAHAIWCASDPAAAWTHWMTERKDPGATNCSSDPIDQLQGVGKAIYVTSTPTIFLSSGQRIEGVVKAADLRKLLETPTATTTEAGSTNSDPPVARSLGSQDAKPH